MEQLIPVINKLQDVFNAIGGDSIDLPQIVVVGSQSSGKSSVLENLVGRDFLPRGSGIVTRRPLVLQLINLPWDGTGEKPDPHADPKQQKKEAAFSEWGEFLHKPNEMFYDFGQIREEIVRETDRLTGKNKGISNVAMHLKVYSPHVLNLTLVDLPGVTKVPVGDQPGDIETQIRRMVLQYIERPNAIVLAVTPANADLANSDALQLAREVDPDGLRTIGVLTKLDIMDRGTDAMDSLCGRTIPLKLGFVGVLNRSQQDIIADKPIRAALKHEQDFFASHPVYRTIAARCGTAFLARTLNRVLMQHIRDCLPELKVKINKMMMDAQLELQTYGDPLYDTKNSQGALLLQILTRFSSDYRDAIDGKLTDQSTNELYGGARINFIFQELFARCLDKLNPTDGLTLNDIRTAIRNATGPRSALFVPEVAFELLVKRQIARLDEPALQCLELVFDELQRIVAQLESKELLRFANLRERVVEHVHALLQRLRRPTKDMILNLMNIEMAYINTNHPDFIGGGGALSTIFERMAQRSQQGQDQWQQSQQQQQQQQHPQLQYQPPPQAQPQQLTAQQAAAQQLAAQAQAAAGRAGQAIQHGAQQAQQMLSGQQQQQVGAPTGGAVPKETFFNTFFGSKDAQGREVAKTATSAAAAYSAVSKQPNQPQPQLAQPQPASAKGKGPAPASAPQQAAAPSQSSQSSSHSSSSSGRLERLEHMPMSIKALAAPSDKERFETELIQSLLVAYFDIVRKNIKDLVPKTTMFFLVNSSKEQIQNELVTALYKEELFGMLLEESPMIASRRNACKSMLEVLRRAHEILTEVRDFSSSGAGQA